jgi:glycine/D-amino acid oxidase-like deaminating enzyme/nitrite reductase/ring-hydroxylating ferredoxin subunit
VAIVGAGITGLTTAYELKKAGVSVVVLEAETLGGGTTGRTSGHLSSLWDRRYSTALTKHGLDKATQIYHALQGAIDYIESVQSELAISCDFVRCPGYLYAEPDQESDEITREYEACMQIGIPVAYAAEMPLPYPIAQGMHIPDQAQFHVLNYLHGLAGAIEGGEGVIFEHSRVTGIEGSNPFTVQTAAGDVSAHHLVLATHTPLGVDPVQAEMTPVRSYVAAVRTETAVPAALFWDVAEPYHYLRPFGRNDRHLVIIGGADRRTGHGEETSAFSSLQDYIQKRFADASIEQTWSAQLYEPADGLPFIGPSLLSQSTYCATGFSGDGLTFGTYAGRTIAAMIAGTAPSADTLFSPRRIPAKGLTELLTHNVEVAKNMILGRLARGTADDLETNEGRIVAFEGQQAAIFKDASGRLHIFRAVCPHMKCIVSWNSSQQTFDCTCHGSRFSTQGTVIEGPSLSGLEPLPHPQ